MGASKDRLEIKIDVLDQPDQRALALADLMPEDMIAATLQEFREIDYLGIDPAEYQLAYADTGKELDGSLPLRSQVTEGAHLKLCERERALPGGGRRPDAPLYLREMASGRVFKLHWLPAIVGRPDRNLRDNQLLAANLETLPAGLRVSRRHVMIDEQNGQYSVRCLSGNPATLRRPTGESRPLNTALQTPITGGDVLYLDRSEIALKFIVRHEESVPVTVVAQENADDAPTISMNVDGSQQTGSS